MRKILSLLLCLLLVISLSVSTYAATITVSGGAAGAVFSAYKLMDVSYDATKSIYNYSLNEKYEDILYSVTDKSTEVEVLDYLLQKKEDTDDNKTAMREFADLVYAAIKTAGYSAEYQSDENPGFSNVATGYYLVAEAPRKNVYDTVSLVMLKTVVDGDGNFTTKEDFPTVDKFVKEVNDSINATGIWGNSANYDIGDKIEFKLEGKVSDKYTEYKDYYYSFVDYMDDTLELSGTTAGNVFTPSDLKIMVDNTPDNIDNGVDVTSQFHIKATKTEFTAKANLKALTGVTIDAGTTIRVTYTAVLTQDAVIGEPGNKNNVYLVYQNDPYAESKGNDTTVPGNPPIEPDNPGKTPVKTVVVFTFKTIVNKVNPNQEPLNGAGFTLYKWIDNDSAWTSVKVIHLNEDADNNNTVFNFKGTDAGIYKLVETKVPDGYNKADDVLFAIAENNGVLSVYDVKMNSTNKPEIQHNKASESFSLVSDPENPNRFTGIYSTNVVNNFGQELPETGGTGTTILYIAGSILVLAAIVLLVTKKRMSSAE